ncbi:MAG: type II toxin-antitoxin system RelE/ParE family toxin [Oscillibacter sp.]|nr:type II toxin-antitoxin system RelE/ParE family toxin [Oscillibacter sp.]
MTIQYSRDSIKFLNKLDKKSVSRIKNAVQGLTEIPPQGDIQVMRGYDDGTKRLRVGSWRVIFQYQAESLLIIDIGNRGDIYK